MTDPYNCLSDIHVQQQKKIESSLEELFKSVFTNQELLDILISILKTRDRYELYYNSCIHMNNGCSLCIWFSKNEKEREIVKSLQENNPYVIDKIMDKLNRKYDSTLKLRRAANNRLLFYCETDSANMSYFYIKLNACQIENGDLKPVTLDGHTTITKMEKEDSCKLVSFKIICEPNMIPYYNIKMRCTDSNPILLKYKTLLGDNISNDSFEM